MSNVMHQNKFSIFALIISLVLYIISQFFKLDEVSLYGGIIFLSISSATVFYSLAPTHFNKMIGSYADIDKDYGFIYSEIVFCFILYVRFFSVYSIETDFMNKISINNDIEYKRDKKIIAYSFVSVLMYIIGYIFGFPEVGYIPILFLSITIISTIIYTKNIDYLMENIYVLKLPELKYEKGMSDEDNIKRVKEKKRRQIVELLFNFRKGSCFKLDSKEFLNKVEI